MNDKITIVPIGLLEASEYQPRTNIDQESYQDLEELAGSISEVGIIQPLIVKQKNNGKYEIIAGERRYRASIIAGLKTLPVIIKEYESKDLMVSAIIDNLQRKDLDPIELGESFLAFMEKFNCDRKHIAKLINKNWMFVKERTLLTRLIPQLKTHLRQGKISIKDCVKISGFTPKDQMEIFNEYLKNNGRLALKKKIAKNKKRQATPTFPKDFFEELRKEMGASSFNVKSHYAVKLWYDSEEELYEAMKNIDIPVDKEITNKNESSE